MAKELPYFQFEPAEYLTKDVSFCSLSAQGLFINLCSYYWQRECNLTRNQFLRRLNNPDELNELIEEGVIDLDNDTIIIKFLDAQYEKATNLSKTNSINGSKGGRPKKVNPIKTENKPNALNSLSETKGIREEKRREDKINYSKEQFLKDWNELRTEHLKKPSFCNRLTFEDKNNLESIAKDYEQEKIRHALIGLFKQKKMPNDSISMQSNPSHFLKFFNTYLTGYYDKNDSLYGKENK